MSVFCPPVLCFPRRQFLLNQSHSMGMSDGKKGTNQNQPQQGLYPWPANRRTPHCVLRTPYMTMPKEKKKSVMQKKYWRFINETQALKDGWLKPGEAKTRTKAL